jgi:hypothetical protein
MKQISTTQLINANTPRITAEIFFQSPFLEPKVFQPEGEQAATAILRAEVLLSKVTSPPHSRSVNSSADFSQA